MLVLLPAQHLQQRSHLHGVCTCWRGDRHATTLPLLGHEILGQNPCFKNPVGSIYLCGIAGGEWTVLLLGAPCSSVGCREGVQKLPFLPCFPCAGWGMWGGSWPKQWPQVMSSHLLPQLHPHSLDRAKQVVRGFSLSFKNFYFFFVFSPVLFLFGTQVNGGEGTFSQALHHMSLVFCVLFFPHCCPCQGKDIVEPLRLAGAVTLPANSLGA